MDGVAGAGFTGTGKCWIYEGAPSLGGGALIYRQKPADYQVGGLQVFCAILVGEMTA